MWKMETEGSRSGSLYSYDDINVTVRTVVKIRDPCMSLCKGSIIEAELFACYEWRGKACV